MSEQTDFLKKRLNYGKSRKREERIIWKTCDCGKIFSAKASRLSTKCGYSDCGVNRERLSVKFGQ